MQGSCSVKSMSKFRFWRSVAICATTLATAGLLVASTSGAKPHASSKKSATSVDAYVTYYGWYDNTPPGCATAYSGCAKGTGTYRHPITFASDTKEFPVGTIIYYPTVEKYFRMGDDCSECDADWKGKGPDGGPRLHHLDLWIGGKGAKEADVIRCEDALTQGMPNGAPLLTPLIVHPPSNLPTSTEQLFNSHTNRCFGGARTKTSRGRYENKKTHQCLRAATGSRVTGAPAIPARCSRAADEDLAFDGAFFSVDKLCLATTGARFGSRLKFMTCSGRARQLWEMGTGGTISWVQYVKCISDVNRRIELASCRLSRANPRNEWRFVPEHRSKASSK
jgi:hypothetical protein